MIRALAALLLLPTLALAQPALPDLPAVGRLGQRVEDARPSCSGTLIGPRQVLTAAHCTGASGNARWLNFYVGWGEGGAAETLRVRSALRGRPRSEREERTGDVAILNLTHPPASAAPLPIARGPVEGGVVRVIAYPWGYDYERRDLTCPVLAVRRTEMILGCQAEGGMSGGAVLVNRGGGWAVAGVVVGRIGTTQTMALRVDGVDLDGLPTLP